MTLLKIVVTKLPHAMNIKELKIIKLFCEMNDFTQNSIRNYSRIYWEQMILNQSTDRKLIFLISCVLKFCIITAAINSFNITINRKSKKDS